MEPNTLSASITEHFDMNGVIFFNISLFHSTTKTTWVASRRYSEFDQIYSSLAEKFSDVPKLPGKGFWKKFSSTFLDDRKQKLNEFLQTVLERQDLLQADELQEFLQIKIYVPNSIKKTPSQSWEISCKCIPISICAADGDICFIALAQSMPNQIENLKVTLLDSEESCIACMKFKGEEMWKITINAKITCLAYSSELTILAAGVDIGGISTYRIKTELEYREYEEYTYMLIHSGTVISICIDYQTSDIYSCGSDRRLVKTNLVHETILQEFVLDSQPVSLQSDITRQRVYVLCRKSGITAFDSNTLIPTMTVSANEFSAFCFSLQGTVFAGSVNGIVNVYKDSVAVMNFLLKSRVTVMMYSTLRKEVFIGNANGYISIWDRSGKLIFIWKAHSKIITSLEVIGNNLFTSGQDFLVKFWSLPVFWVDPDFEKIETIEAEIQKKTVRVLTTQHKIKDTDELKGWDKN